LLFNCYAETAATDSNIFIWFQLAATYVFLTLYWPFLYTVSAESSALSSATTAALATYTAAYSTAYLTLNPNYFSCRQPPTTVTSSCLYI